ncbi:hypothetical protein Tco_0222093 [Tanacetum coccineum]
MSLWLLKTYENTKGTEDGNVGQGVTPITSIAPNTCCVLMIIVHDSPTTGNSALIRSGTTSYPKLVTSEPSRKSVNFCSFIVSGGNRADMAILLEYIQAISEWFANTTYGFFSRKRVAYLVVANSNDGSDAMLENGPWYIHNNSFILKKWNPNVILQKEYVGASLMLDSYTSDMCMQSWGRSSYDRVMIELRADEELENTIMVAMSILVGEGFSILVSNKNGARTSGKKKQAKVTRQEVNNSNLFYALNSIENDADLGKLLLVDDDGKPLTKVVSMANTDSDSKVEEAFDK